MTNEVHVANEEQRWDEKIVGGIIHHHASPQSSLIASLGDIPRDAYCDIHFLTVDDGTSYTPQPPMKGVFWRGIAMAIEGNVSMAIIESPDLPMPVVVEVTRIQAVLTKFTEIHTYEMRAS